MKLSDLKKGERAKVVYINNSNHSLKRRMLDMGITSGAEVLVKKVAPLGDPICIELRGYELCLRKHDLCGIEVHRL